MVRITEDLIRKRAEHNECIISTLEEISLHQQDIEKIEYIGKWCRHLKILYLQSNLIPKIENISKLKELEYLNLAINNIEKFENLNGCESLSKLDLTVNFIGCLTSISDLKDLEHLQELFLTGNPCCDYKGYRDYVIATLPQLKKLDGTEIEKSERIQALQRLPAINKQIKLQEFDYVLKRKRQIIDAEFNERKRQNKNSKKPGFDGNWYTNINPPKSTCTITELASDDEGDLPEGQVQDVPYEDDKDNEKESKQEIGDGDAVVRKKKPEETKEQKAARIEQENAKEKEYWDEPSDYTPESRVEMYNHMKEVERKKTENNTKEFDPNPKRVRKLQTDEGRILNVNEAAIDFTLTESDKEDKLILDVAVFRYMDTEYLEVDVQPKYVKILIKKKVLQLVLTHEVKPDSSTARRSEATGHLVVTMPLLKPKENICQGLDYKKIKKDTYEMKKKEQNNFLEVDHSLGVSVDFMNLTLTGQARKNDDDFVDDLSVPPLE